MKSTQRLFTATFTALAIAGLSTATFAECRDCGTVTEVKSYKKEGEASGVGAVAGGVIGGVLGHQVGSGRGNTAATIVGAGAGAYAGNQVEKNQKSHMVYAVHIKMDDGRDRTFNFSSPTSYQAGDKVKIVDGKLVRQ